jgi:FHA domain-containing protein
MLKISVLSVNGLPPLNGSLEATFGASGGTIGRADGNTLVLPDPNREISRVHIRIVSRAGSYSLLDEGSNPIALNGMGVDGPQALQPGDLIQLGSYVLVVAQEPQIPQNPAAISPAQPATIAHPPAKGLTDPLDPFEALFGGSEALPFGADHPLATPRAAPAQQSPSTTAFFADLPPDHPLYEPPPASSPKADWGSPTAAELPKAAQTMPHAHLQDIGIDALLGDLAAGGRPFEPPPTTRPAAQSGPSGPATTEFGLSAAERRSDLYAPMPTLHARTEPTLAHIPEKPAVRPNIAWGQTSAAPGAGAARLPPIEKAVHTQPPVLARNASALSHAHTQQLQQPPRQATAPGATATNASESSPDTLTQALFHGLGLDSPAEALTPALMEHIGTLLRLSLSGTMELLAARTAVKRELRAEVTMIAARENNPMKFSPSYEAAILHLLGQPKKGFMHGFDALDDAYTDLKAHQLGVMAGMRAALSSVLAMFSPALLEGRLTRGSVIQSLIPSSRKAKLWDLYNEHYTELRNEAEDDFQKLFGKAFLQAYEEYSDRLREKS